MSGMNILITVAVTFFAGMGAGLGTGFAGMSAAAVISPMLITFLGIEPYTAVGIALASDVLASAVSAYTYGKSKNLDIKNGLIMMASVLAFTVLGSFLASLLPSAAMGNFSVFMTFLLGIKFIVRPVMTTKEAMMSVTPQKRAVQAAVCGTVFIMTFTALTGAISHFAIGDTPDITVLVLCIVFTFIWARIAAVFANRAEPKTLNRATGVVLVILGAAIFLFSLIK